MTVVGGVGGGDLVTPRRARAARRPASGATGALVTAAVLVGGIVYTVVQNKAKAIEQCGGAAVTSAGC